jgi:hypothetical protein
MYSFTYFTYGLLNGDLSCFQHEEYNNFMTVNNGLERMREEAVMICHFGICLEEERGDHVNRRSVYKVLEPRFEREASRIHVSCVTTSTPIGKKK